MNQIGRLIVPAIIFLFGVVTIHWMFPIFSGIFSYDYDPAYQYLMNGLGLMYGFAPNHIDHPGTPVQLFIGVASAVTWAVRTMVGATSLTFARDVITTPETYLLTIAYLFLVMNCAAIFYLGLRVSRATRSASAGIASQAGYLLLGNTFPRFVYVSPEAVLIFAAAMLMAVMSDVVFADKRPTNGATASVGFFIALGITSKVTFLPLALAVFLFLDLRAVIVASVLVLAFATGMLLPILRRLHDMYNWYRAIATHDGIYGNGNDAFMVWDEAPARLMAFIKAVPLYFAGLSAAAITSRHSLRGAIFLTIGVVQLVLGLKHFGIHYVLPFLAICPVILVWTMLRLDLRWYYRNVAMLFMIAGVVQLVGANQVFAVARAERDARVAALTSAVAKFPGALVIPTYHSYYAPYAMHFGAGAVDPRFSSALGLGRNDNLMFWYGNRLLGIPGRAGKPLSFLHTFLDAGRPVLIVQAAGTKITPAEATTTMVLDLGDGQSLDQIIEVH